jgi:hypothetical protein
MRSEGMSLHDLAVSRLRALFGPKVVADLLGTRLKPRPPSKCSERACPFPPFKNGLCRGHAADSIAEYSFLPSALGCKTVPQARSTHAHASESPKCLTLPA